jgi:hypothetical protein
MHVHACIILSLCVGRFGSVGTIYVYTCPSRQQALMNVVCSAYAYAGWVSTCIDDALRCCEQMMG